MAVLAVGGMSAAVSAQDADANREVIESLRRFEESLGLKSTGNFEKRSGKDAASYRCYYTGKLELPRTYDELDLRQVKGPGGCGIDETRYDVFYYAIEAVASGNTPITSRLESAPLERVLVVVPHEDLHDARELKDLPVAVAEAATTLMGFHTAAAFARERYGAESATYQNLAREAGLFLQKAEIVNRYFDRLEKLYKDAREGRASVESALAAKAEAYEQLQRECKGISPAPASFNACPAAMNNAGLAFDATYTRYYPLIYNLYVSQGSDLAPLLQALSPAARGKAKSESEVAAYLENLIAR